MKGCSQYFKHKQNQYDLSLSAYKSAWCLTSAVWFLLHPLALSLNELIFLEDEYEAL